MYAAPAHAVSIMTPLAFTISDERGKIRKSLGRYWKMMANLSTFLAFVVVEPSRFGITSHIINWNTERGINECKIIPMNPKPLEVASLNNVYFG